MTSSSPVISTHASYPRGTTPLITPRESAARVPQAAAPTATLGALAGPVPLAMEKAVSRRESAGRGLRATSPTVTRRESAGPGPRAMSPKVTRRESAGPGHRGVSPTVARRTSCDAPVQLPFGVSPMATCRTSSNVGFPRGISPTRLQSSVISGVSHTAAPVSVSCVAGAGAPVTYPRAVSTTHVRTIAARPPDLLPAGAQAVSSSTLPGMPAGVSCSKVPSQQALGTTVYTPRLAAPSQVSFPSSAVAAPPPWQKKCEAALSLLSNQCTLDQERLSETLALENQLAALREQCLSERTLRMSAELELERRVANDNLESRAVSEPQTSAQPSEELLAVKEQLCVLGDECIRQRGLRISAETELIQMMQVIESLQEQLGQAQSDSDQLQEQLGQAQSDNELMQRQFGQAQSDKETMEQELGQSQTDKELMQQKLRQAQSDKELMQRELGQAQTENELMEARVFALGSPRTETPHSLQTYCQDYGGTFETLPNSGNLETLESYESVGGTLDCGAVTSLEHIQGDYPGFDIDIEAEIQEHYQDMGGNIE